jgi:hypothetical protein
MDEYVMKQKIQTACFEPQAPERLIQQVILRAQTIATGMVVQKQQITDQKPAPLQELERKIPDRK